MKSITQTCVISHPKKVVFEFLSDLENMPKWSTQFVKSTKIVNGKKKAETPFGEVFIRIDSDYKSGVIDIFAGPQESKMNPAFMRVISFSDNSCGLTFTFFQWPETTEQIWEIFCNWIKIEVGNIEKIFS
ncbi:MAG: SRPBCC family protein [Candidatus Nitrosotenuis sp.]